MKHEDHKDLMYHMFSISYVFGTLYIYNKDHLMPPKKNFNLNLDREYIQEVQG